MSTLAFYALVRFVPDLERQEPVNVGLIVSRGNEIQVRFLPERIHDEGVDVVRRFEGLVNHLIEEEKASRSGGLDGQLFLAQLAFRRFSHFDITEPRQVVWQETLDSLLANLSQRLEAAPEGIPELV